MSGGVQTPPEGSLSLVMSQAGANVISSAVEISTYPVRHLNIWAEASSLYCLQALLLPVWKAQVGGRMLMQAY
jgi:hypothetical protein